tara:strand:+ start:209 stop:499 length:291 start_codon:yes stop_codon:yes gene_type:complete
VEKRKTPLVHTVNPFIQVEVDKIKSKKPRKAGAETSGGKAKRAVEISDFVCDSDGDDHVSNAERGELETTSEATLHSSPFTLLCLTCTFSQRLGLG